MAKIHRKIIEEIQPYLTEGTTGIQINDLVGQLCEKYDIQAGFFGVYDFPCYLCININNCVVHGIPNDIPFKEGDVITFDFWVKKGGFYTDAAFTKIIGEKKDPKKIHFVEATKYALDEALKLIKHGIKVNEIGTCIQKNIEKSGYKIIKNLTGHGLGKTLHDIPYIYNYNTKENIGILKEGMVIAIEPIVGYSSGDIYISDNEWDILMKDGGLGAQWEHCLMVTKNGYELFV